MLIDGSRSSELRVFIIIAVLLAVAACGGGKPEETPLPTAPPEAATPGVSLATPATAPADSADADLREYLEFLDATCRDPEEAEETWGGMVRYLEDSMGKLKGRRPPEELRGYVDATVALMQVVLGYAEEQDPGTRLDEDAEWQAFAERPEFQVALTPLNEARSVMDPGLALAVRDAGC